MTAVKCECSFARTLAVHFVFNYFISAYIKFYYLFLRNLPLEFSMEKFRINCTVKSAFNKMSIPIPVNALLINKLLLLCA
jgi:hypothetical protein